LLEAGEHVRSKPLVEFLENFQTQPRTPFALSLSKCRISAISDHPEPVEGQAEDHRKYEHYMRTGFDRLSPNGVGFVFDFFVFPIILSLSKDRLSPNGFRCGCGCVG
jgi:hypothetical protein